MRQCEPANPFDLTCQCPGQRPLRALFSGRFANGHALVRKQLSRAAISLRTRGTNPFRALEA